MIGSKDWCRSVRMRSNPSISESAGSKTIISHLSVLIRSSASVPVLAPTNWYPAATKILRKAIRLAGSSSMTRMIGPRITPAEASSPVLQIERVSFAPAAAAWEWIFRDQTSMPNSGSDNKGGVKIAMGASPLRSVANKTRANSCRRWKAFVYTQAPAIWLRGEISHSRYPYLHGFCSDHPRQRV